MLSIVIPTRLTAGRHLRTLRSLTAQDIDGEPIEVLVVVDGLASRGSTVGEGRLPFPMRVIEQPHEGQAAARNRGAAEAGGDRLLFLDDDVELASGFLRQMIHQLDNAADVVLPDLQIGPWVPDTLPVRIVRRQQRAERESWRAGAPIVFEDMVFAATAIRRAPFEAAGGFDTTFTAGGAYGNEDIELGYRLLRHGVIVRRALDAVAQTDFPHAVPALVSRARLVGRNDVLLARKHPSLALPLFGRKLIHSRIHRLVGTIVLLAPPLASGRFLVRWAIRRGLFDRGDEGRWISRLWLALRSSWYWRGVADADGREIAFAGRDAIRRQSARRPPDVVGHPFGPTFPTGR